MIIILTFLTKRKYNGKIYRNNHDKYVFSMTIKYNNFDYTYLMIYYIYNYFSLLIINRIVLGAISLSLSLTVNNYYDNYLGKCFISVMTIILIYHIILVLYFKVE